MDTNKKPSILIVSISNTPPKSLIKLITKNTKLTSDDESIICTPWTMDTKYYKAEVDLIGISETFQRSEQFSDNVEALIIHMDSNKASSLDKEITKWASLEDECEPEIKLLLTNYCNEDTKVSRTKATTWCLKHGYELIELYPQKNDVSDDSSIIVEKFGVDRVIEALQSHTWSNLVMKNSKSKNSGEKEEQNLADLCEEILAGEDDDDDFSQLFAQLSTMKESLQSMPVSQRKQCAEQVVSAFWRTIGGDDDEIDDD